MTLLLLLGGFDAEEATPAGPSDADLLDLLFGQRTSSFRYYLLDAANQRVGTLDVDVTAGHPVVANAINRTIKRTMSQFVLPPATRADVDPLVHRVQPCMVLANGTEWPLGILLWATMTDEQWEFGDFGHGQLGDQGVILSQPVSSTRSYAPGVLVTDALEAEFADAGLVAWDIDPTITTRIGAPVAWPAGTERSRICAELCAKAGAFSPWFSNAGVATVRRSTDLNTTTPDLIYDVGPASRVLRGSRTRSNDVLDAPNQYVVIDGSAAASPIVGVYDAPDAAPHSRARRGFTVARVIQEDGLESPAAATERARAAYDAATLAYEHAQFSGPPDPRHDTFQVIQYQGVNYREQGWSMPLREGSEMVHDLRRSYLGTEGEEGT